MKQLPVIVGLIALFSLAALPMSAQEGEMDMTHYIECESTLVMIQAITQEAMAEATPEATPEMTETPLRFVEITRPFDGMGTHTQMLLVEGMAGGAFENNIVVQVMDSEGTVLAEAPATVDTPEVGGSGPFSVEMALDAEPGTTLTITAFQPAVADGEQVTISDTVNMVVSPTARPLSSLLIVQPDDPMLAEADVCAAAEAAMTSTTTLPIVINNVMAIQTMSLPPFVNVNIQAAKPSVCPLPLRARMTASEAVYTIELYFEDTGPVPCTRDLRPFGLIVPLGMVEASPFTIIVNGQTVQ
jgi:hypothetical protein